MDVQVKYVRALRGWLEYRQPHSAHVYFPACRLYAAPPVPEQDRIVAEVERRLSVIDELEATVAANLKRAADLRQSILKKAFEGKLVPYDPSDEPASVLLERIRAERSARARAGRRSRVRTFSNTSE